MLKILHKGIQVNLDLDTTGFTGDVEADTALVAAMGLEAGCLVGINATGKCELSDGLAAAPYVLGFLVNDAVGYFYENKPALASNKLAVTLGNCVVITNKTIAGVTAGDKLYSQDTTPGTIGTVADNTDGIAVGVAGNDVALDGDELTVYV